MTFPGRSVRRRIRMPCFLTTGIMSGKEYRLSEKIWTAERIRRKRMKLFCWRRKNDEGSGRSGIRFAPLAVFCTFFVAELGDKTQLTAITFGANEGMSSALIVWLGCSLGLFLADILGMLLGYLLKSRTPEGLLNTLAFAIFSVFGVFTLYQGLKLINTDIRSIPVLPILIVATIAFAGICMYLFLKREKKAKAAN